MRKLLLVLWLGMLPATVPADGLAQLRAAAEGGDPWAQLNLGAAYDNGIGVTADPERALGWYRRAAAQGLPEACFNLGHLLASRGSTGEALPWLLRAAQGGLADAQYLVGVLYAEGDGVAQDRVEARRWLDAASAAGHEAARQYRSERLP